jgi:hypothetical protein
VSDDRTQPERDSLLLEHLERRRSEYNAATWQAPTLTFAGQAFLLIVLSDGGLDRAARLIVLIAGITATLAALVSLRRLLARERLYSEAIAARLRALGVGDPRPADIEKDLLDRQLDPPPRLMRSLPGAAWLWMVALGLFIAADVVVFILA